MYKKLGPPHTGYERACTECECFLISWKISSHSAVHSNFLFARIIWKNGSTQSFSLDKKQFNAASWSFKHWTSLCHVSNFISSIAFIFLGWTRLYVRSPCYPGFFKKKNSLWIGIWKDWGQSCVGACIQRLLGCWICATRLWQIWIVCLLHKPPCFVPACSWAFSHRSLIGCTHVLKGMTL